LSYHLICNKVNQNICQCSLILLKKFWIIAKGNSPKHFIHWRIKEVLSRNGFVTANEQIVQILFPRIKGLVSLSKTIRRKKRGNDNRKEIFYYEHKKGVTMLRLIQLFVLSYASTFCIRCVFFLSSSSRITLRIRMNLGVTSIHSSC
jgi:RNase P subunit RPR2